MQRIFTKFLISVRGFGYRNKTCSKASEPHQNYIDPKTNIIYGGDLQVPISDKSVGSILFNRMLRSDRREEVMQVCATRQVSMTTREFLEKTVALAEKLKEDGLMKGDFIILIGNNSLNMNITLIGTIFAGGVAVPITQNIGFLELEIIVKSLKPKFIGCDGKYLELFRKAFFALPEFSNSKIFLIYGESYEPDAVKFEDFIKGRGRDFESFQPSEADNAEEELVLGLKAAKEGYRGRIVGITHRNINSTIALYDCLDTDGLRLRKDIDLMVTKYYWMTGLYPLLLSCCYGSKLIVMDYFNEERFLKVINDYKVTETFLYSSKCWRLYKHTPREKYDLSSCRQIFTDDGFLPKILIHGWKEKFGMILRPSYTIPEIAGFPLRPPSDFPKEPSSGKILPNLYAKVTCLKTSKNLGPTEPGEICFKGPLVSRGYINDRKATQHLFDRDGFLQTGHYGFYKHDGVFYIIDRIIYQIRYKNYEISPKELEGIIKLLDPIKDACVAGIKHPTDGEHPVAFVSLQPKHKITEKEILDFVNSEVDDYKKLRAVFFLPKIPRFRSTGSIKRNLFAHILSKYQMKED